MFFFFSKLFAFIIDPVLWIVGFLVAALWSKSRSKRKFLAVLGGLLFLTFANYPLYNYALEKWCEPCIKTPNLAHVYDYAIILGGFGEYHYTTKRIQLDEEADRLLYPVYLYKKGIVKKLVISGDALIRKDGLIDPRNDFIQWMETMGVSREDIILETEAQNTVDHTRLIPTLLGGTRYKAENSLLVTSALHMRRSMATFHKAGLYPVPCATKLPLSTRIGLTNYAPSVVYLNKWNQLLHEWAGLQIYRLMGYAE